MMGGTWDGGIGMKICVLTHCHNISKVEQKMQTEMMFSVMVLCNDTYDFIAALEDITDQLRKNTVQDSGTAKHLSDNPTDGLHYVASWKGVSLVED